MRRIRLNPLHRYPQDTPAMRRCPRCHSPRLHHHGWRWRPIRDWTYPSVRLLRLRCAACGATWTVYPEGVTPGSRFSLRAEQLMVLLYVLGLSYRATAAVMSGLGVRVAPSTVLNFVQSRGAREELYRQRRYWQGRVKVRRIGFDATEAMREEDFRRDTGVLVVLDETTGVGLWVETVDEQDAQALAQTVEQVLATFEPGEAIAGEGPTYPEALG